MGFKKSLLRVGARLRNTIKRGVSRVFGRKAKSKGSIKPTRKPTKKPPNLIQDLAPKSDGALPARQMPALPEISPLRAGEEFSRVQLSPHTTRAYTQDLRDFFSYLKIHDLFTNWNTAIGPADIAGYRDFLIQKGLSKPTVTRKLAVLKSFYKWTLAQGWVHRNPAELVRTFPQSQDSKTGFLTDQEIDRLLLRTDWATDRLASHLAKVVVETLLMLGVRRSEAARIRLGALEYSDSRYLVNIEGKGDRSRRLPVPERLVETWEAWLRRLHADIVPSSSKTMETSPGEWMDFFSRCSAQPLLVSTRAKTFDVAISPGEIARIVRKMARKAGLVQRVSPHMLRATAITHALDQGASHRGVQQMAGWTSPLMISRYDKRRKDPRFSAVLNLKYAKKDSAQKEMPETRRHQESESL